MKVNNLNIDIKKKLYYFDEYLLIHSSLEKKIVKICLS